MLRVSNLTGFNAGGPPVTAQYNDVDVFRVPEVSRWQTTFSVSLTSSTSGFSAYTVRQMIPAGLISLSGQVARLELIGSFYTIDQMFIGEQSSTGDPYDMRTSPAPAQVRVAGDTTIRSDDSHINDTPIITDPINFPIDEAKHYIITAHFATVSGSSASMRRGTVTGAVQYLKPNSSEASIADVTGYSSNANLVGLVSKIQVITNINNLMFPNRMPDAGEAYHLPVITGGGGTPDTYWSSVVFITGYEGATGSTNVTDEGPLHFGTGNIQDATGGSSPLGKVTQGVKKYGSASFQFDGATSLRWGNTGQSFNFAAGPFTVETFFNPNTVTGTTQCLVGKWDPANQRGWMLCLNGNTLTWNVSTTGVNVLTDITGGTVTAGVWYHVAVDFDGTKYRLYLNGAMVGSFGTPRTIYNAFAFFAIGSDSNNSGLWYDGYLDETRINKGVARYASDSGFTVPASAFIRA